MSEWKESVLGQYVYLSNEKIDGQYVSLNNYISTDNMLSNLGGVEIANNLPNQTKYIYFRKGDVLFSNIRTYFKKVWRAEFSGGCSNDVLVFKTFEEGLLEQSFLYYIISSDSFINYTSVTAKGTKMPRGDKDAIKNYGFKLPSIETQKEIAKTLSKLDQKITLLRQQNQDLEELAQTLFKRWFVEFEFPNENGEPYKSSGGKMVESELGEIPAGWSIGEISNHVSHSTKSINPNNEADKEFYHYSIPAFDNGKYPVLELGNEILSNKYIVAEKSILVSKLNPSTSRIWTVFIPKPNAICSTEIQVFIPKQNRYAFTFGLFHYDGVKKEMAQRASGTSSSHQRVRPGDILNIECIVPATETMKKFNVAVFDLLKKAEVNQEEIQTLTQLRDTLLPKLMSGDLRVMH